MLLKSAHGMNSAMYSTFEGLYGARILSTPLMHALGRSRGSDGSSGVLPVREEENPYTKTRARILNFGKPSLEEAYCILF